MQIRLGTARAMGYGGDASGLLDADTNMTYAVRYLAGAYRAAGGNQDQAIRNYQRGYYDKAKAQGFSPYAAASASPPQAAAPDPTMLRQPQELERRNESRSSSGWSGTRCSMLASAQQKAGRGRPVSRTARRCCRLEPSSRRPPSRRELRSVRPCVQERTTVSRRCSSGYRQRNAAEQSAPSSARRSCSRGSIASRRNRHDGESKQKAPRAQPPRIGPQAQPSAQPVAAARRVAPAADLRLVQSDALLQASVASGAPAASAIARRSLCKTAPRGAAIRAPARSRRAGAACGA